MDEAGVEHSFAVDGNAASAADGATEATVRYLPRTNITMDVELSD